MVDGNVFLSSSLGWNCCVNFIAAAGSAQSAIYYISNYMSKNPTVAKAILPLVYTAICKRKLYPSSADDKGTQRRNATYLTQIVLNLLNGGDECSDQMAASAVYNLKSYMSSHSFVNLYVIDFLKYVKSGGNSLDDEITHASDMEDGTDDEGKDSQLADMSLHGVCNTGYGQQPRATHQRLSAEEGSGVHIAVVKNVEDYIYRGKDLEKKIVSPYTYRALITRVGRRQMERRSSVKHHPGKQKSLTFEFDEEHPLAHSHVQRLNIKPRVVKLVGKTIPKDPGPWQSGDDFDKWYKKKKAYRLYRSSFPTF